MLCTVRFLAEPSGKVPVTVSEAVAPAWSNVVWLAAILTEVGGGSTTPSKMPPTTTVQFRTAAKSCDCSLHSNPGLCTGNADAEKTLVCRNIGKLIASIFGIKGGGPVENAGGAILKGLSTGRQVRQGQRAQEASRDFRVGCPG